MTKDSNTQMEAILDAVGAAVITINEQGIILSVNAGATSIFAYTADEMVGQNVKMLMPEPYRSEHDGYIRHHLETGENKIIGTGRRVSGRRSDSTSFPMHLSVARYAEGDQLRFAGIVHDLTELERSQASSARLGRIIDESINEVFVFNTQDLRFTIVNRGALANLGYTLDELTGMTPVDIKPLHNKISFGRIIEPLLSGEKQRIRFDTVHQRKDGSRYDVEVDLNLSDAVDPPEFIAIIQDVTDRNRQRELYRRSQKLQSIGNLTGGIAHDFNNLLTVISGNLELLESMLDKPEQTELLKEAQNASQMGARLTNRLLAFASRGQLSPRNINLNSLVRDLSDMLRRTLGEAVCFDTKLTPQLWNASVDVSELENALVNLSINARDAMPEGGKLMIETANVSVEAEPFSDLDIEPGDYVKLSVTDSGCGISPELQDTVFEPFVTTKQGVHGTGLGLSMVYGFARQSGGRVTLYSEVNEGSTFSIYLPRDKSSGVDTVTPSRPVPTFLDPLKILVAEDADSVRKLTVKRLEHMGHEVIQAIDGYVAVELFKQHKNIDLVFTDMVMTAGMSGYDLALAIRQLDPDARILMTSGYAEDVINPEKLEEGGFDLLRKPFQQSELADAIMKVMDITPP